MSTHSKGYKRFYDRMNYFRIDKEIINIVCLNSELLAGEEKIFHGVNKTDYPLLFVRQNNESSRKLITTHLQHTIYVSFLKELYEEVTEYIRYVLREGAMNGADTRRLVGEHNVNMKANDILSKGSKKEIVEYIMSSIFQQLENERSTLELIKKITTKLGLKVPENVINDAMPYLELRHVFVHSDGKPSLEFRQRYPQFKLDMKKKVKLSSSDLDEAYNTVNKLLLKFDSEMMRLNYISSNEIV